MTDPGPGLLQAILDDPDDHAVRLVYADYLEEHGDPRQRDRGEFIRLQVLRAQQDPHTTPTERERALWQRHSDEWTREAQPFDPARVQLYLQRGFLEYVSIEGGTDEDLVVLRRLPTLLTLRLGSCRVSPLGLAHVAALRHLRGFGCDQTEIGEAGLRVLEGLPCWTLIRITDGGFEEDGEAWRAFQERRIGRFAELPPPQRQRAARWFFSQLSLEHRVGDPIKKVSLCQDRLDDAEMRFFPEIQELEEIDFFQAYGLTGAGLQHLRGMPNLKSVAILKSEIDSICPLTSSPALESLRVWPYYHAVITDEGTEGLDRLTNLRVLHLDSDGLADATVVRLRSLRRLRELELQLGPLANEGCLEAISGLTELESLAINRYFDDPRRGFSDAVLRHVAPLRRLRSLYLNLNSGNGEGLRYLAGLTELRFLQLSGSPVTDAGIRHLASLRQLRTLLAQPSSITEAGACWLAERLPAVTIITLDHVVKSPREAMTFRRRCLREWASALFPEHWADKDSESIRLREDGTEDITCWSGGKVGPAEIRFSVSESESQPTAEEELHRWVENNPHFGPRVLEVDPVTWAFEETASCIYEDDRARHLTCVAVGRRIVVLDCEAPVGRFDTFRPLFFFVARSVRFGPAAREGADERVEVPSGEIG